MANTKLFLDTRNLDKTGCGTLRLTLFHRNTSTTSTLGIKLKPDQWDGAHIVNHPEKKNLDLIASKKKSDVDMMIFRMESDGQLMPDNAKDLMLKINEALYPSKYAPKKTTFVDVFNMVVARKKGNTKRSYECALKKMRAYDSLLDKKTFEDLDSDWFEDFIDFMAQTMSWNGQRNYLRSIRVIFNYARKKGVTTNYPFYWIDMSRAPTQKKALTLKQLQRMRTMPLDPWQEEYRDMFMLMFYLIGINAVDLFNAKPEQLVNGRLEYIRSKTGKQYSIKVEPEAMAIINKYRGEKFLISPCDRYARYADYLHHMNHALRTFGMTYKSGTPYVGKPAFPEDIASYWTRHSWSTLAFDMGIPVGIVAEALGHGDFDHAITMIYIKPNQKLIDEANRRVIDAVLAE